MIASLNGAKSDELTSSIYIKGGINNFNTIIP